MAIFYESLCAYATHKHRNHAELTRSVKLITLISSLCNLETHWPPVSNAGETDKAINDYHMGLMILMLKSQRRCLVRSI